MGNSSQTDAILETNSNLTTLAAHYKAQLEQSGCVLIGEGQDGQLAWITWTLKDNDKQYHGFFILLKELDQEYYLQLRMKSSSEPPVWETPAFTPGEEQTVPCLGQGWGRFRFLPVRKNISV